MYPLQGEDQVQLPHVSGILKLAPAELGQVEIAENVEAMIHADDYYVAAFAQPDPVGTRRIPGACGIAAAMEPDHHRTLAAVLETLESRRSGSGSLHSLHSAAPAERVAAPSRAPSHRRPVWGLRAGLGACGPQRQSIANTRPRLGRESGHETALGCVVAIGNAFEDVDAVVDVPPDLPEFCRSHWSFGGPSFAWKAARLPPLPDSIPGAPNDGLVQVGQS